jgi:3-oxoacyl-[acyl-carrier protein] reductase
LQGDILLKDSKIILITGTSKGIGRFLVKHYLSKGHYVIGCSRSSVNHSSENYKHFCIDICNEEDVKTIFRYIRKTFNKLDILINNAGIASMNHSLLTPVSTVQKIFEVNVIGSFLFARESAKILVE